MAFLHLQQYSLIWEFSTFNIITLHTNPKIPVKGISPNNKQNNANVDSSILIWLEIYLTLWEREQTH